MLKTTLAVLLATCIAAPVLAATTCKEKPLRVNGNAHPDSVKPWIPENYAESIAKYEWLSQCTKRYGQTWCAYDTRKNERFICNKGPNGIGGWKWICEYEALPCRNS